MIGAVNQHAGDTGLSHLPNRYFLGALHRGWLLDETEAARRASNLEGAPGRPNFALGGVTVRLERRYNGRSAGCYPDRVMPGIGDQNFLMSASAASWASVSEAKSSGVTTLRTLSPPTLSNRRIFGIMAARQCPGLRRYVTIENSETFAIDRLGGQIFACYGAMSTACWRR
jgi:hypothetical protein